MTNVRKAINNISGLHVNGATVEDEETIKFHVEDHFRSLFSEQRPFRPKVDGLNLPQLEEAQLGWLDRPFDEEEVKKAV